MSVLDMSAWLNIKPYALNAKQKSEKLAQALLELTQWHFTQCPEYRCIFDSQRIDPNDIRRLEDIPFIPVRLFKEFELLSVPRQNVFKTMTSSGTSGQKVSRIYLDRDTATNQTKILSRIMTQVLGEKRLPMLVIDSPSILKDRQTFSARGAGILGFSMFGQDVTYALDESMKIDLDTIKAFLARHPEGPVFIFGFTFMIWQYLVMTLQQKNIRLPLERAIILHGGGWKKLQDHAVDNLTFHAVLRKVTGIKKIFNYYGMVEQTGSLFMECESGHLHAPVYADVIVRKGPGFEVAENGEEGVIEVLSMLPRSYPGHVLLTEDIGVIHGEDDCSCGRLGKYFEVRGRVAQAEIRGCSDTHESHS